MNRIFRYFDLSSEVRASRPKSKSAEKSLHWFPQYLALLLGIIAQPFIQEYFVNGSWNLHGLLSWIVASAFVAIMAFPSIYKSSFDPQKPIFVQFCVIFTSGMGWQSLLGATGEALGSN
ncbi:MAG: hypothetical protein AAGG02_01165 [Cyanobacteria bacterium P01_H01_bin.15]